MKRILMVALAAVAMFPSSAEAKQISKCKPRLIRIQEFQENVPNLRWCDRLDVIMNEAGGFLGNRERCDDMGGRYQEGLAYGKVWSVCVDVDF